MVKLQKTPACLMTTQAQLVATQQRQKLSKQSLVLVLKILAARVRQPQMICYVSVSCFFLLYEVLI